MRSQWTRRVVPRWRSSAVSATLPDNTPLQLGAPKKKARYAAAVAEDIVRKIDAWNDNPSLGVAADLLNFSHIAEVSELLAAPAKYLLANDSRLSPQITSIANNILGKSLYSEYGPGSIRQKEIIKLKKQIALNPRNAIALIDMARIYVISAQRSHAARAIQTAVALQPNNRFVLRSASRFYLHDGDPDRAVSILKKSARTQEDPWLLASMVAIETVQEKAPIYYKRAKTILENARFSPIHLSELGASFATLHLNSGNLKDARRAFTAALKDPNENAVAQAIWAANEFSMPINIQPAWLSDRFSSEANYYTQEKIGDYGSALRAARNWFDDEPFSTRALLAGSFAASVIGFYDVAEDMLRQALIIDPHCTDTKNNLSFCLAGQDKIQEAIDILNDVYLAEAKTEDGVSGHTFANRGMIYYRQGDIELGNKGYEHATLLFERRKQNSSKAVALAYWVQEASLAKDPSLEKIIEQARKFIEISDSKAAQIVLARATDQVVPEGEAGKTIYKQGLIWTHDNMTNTLIADRKKPFRV